MAPSPSRTLSRYSESRFQRSVTRGNRFPGAMPQARMIQCAFGASPIHGGRYSAFATCVRFIEMDLLTLTEIRRAASRTGGSAVPARVHVQVEPVAENTQRACNPCCEPVLAGGCDR